MRLASLLSFAALLMSSCPARAQSCALFQAVIETKSSSTNWAKCGHQEFESSDPPRIRLYLINQAQSGSDYSYSASGSTGGSWGNGCTSLDGSWSVEESTQGTISAVTEYEPLSCVYTSVYSGTYYLLQDHDDGRQTTCYPSGGPSCSYSYENDFREDDASIEWVNFGGTWEWRFVGSSHILIETDGNCMTPTDVTNEISNPVSEYFPSTLITNTPTFREYEDVSDDTVVTRTESLQTEYTDARLYNVITTNLMPAYPTEWQPGRSSAFSSINETHINGCAPNLILRPYFLGSG